MGVVGIPGKAGSPQRHIVRRFDSKSEIKKARKEGIKIDPVAGEGPRATTINIEPIDPDRIRDATGARNADYYMNTDATNRRTRERRTKRGRIEIVIMDDIHAEDIIDSRRVAKSSRSRE
jgi:hypothetical protein